MTANTHVAAPRRKLRVLCLHGFRTNRQVMEAQTRGIQAALGNNAEFVFLNGPFESRGPTDEIITKMFGDTAPFHQWWASRHLKADEKAELAAADPSVNIKIWNLHYEDIDQSLEYVDEQLQQLGEFDIAIGFSQGAAMLTLLTMWYHQKLKKRWWKLVICVCGVRIQGINMRELFETADGEPIPIPFPSIHIAGQKDSLYAKSLMLKDMYTPFDADSSFERVLFEHNSGHKFPSPGRNKELYGRLGELILQFFGREELLRPAARL